MPILSRIFLLRRLALLRRAPFWAQAFALCALFAIAGLGILDDYGITGDEPWQRQTASTVADYALGVSEEPPLGHDRYYGVAFEMPLLLAERALGLQDTRHIYLTRHLLTHLFFIAGGFACGMLAYRMFGSRWIALLAMLLFLLHPRLYGHSFFNSKDIPFAVMLAVALYLAHRAFRRDTIGAFLLCGIGAGLAINLRVFGLMLLPMILAMRAPDLWQAGREERKHILASAGIFAGAALATVYIIHPYYWENPLRFIEGALVLSQHPTIQENLFMGKIYMSDAVPWNYIPVWFAITAPPVTLALGVIGCAAAFWHGVSRPLAALRDSETRFRILLLGCFALPIAVVIALQARIYQDWRHLYFLWGPFCLLAAVGLHHIANIRMGEGIWKVSSRLPRWVRGCGRLHMARRALAYGVVSVGLITTLTAMAALHPYQKVYFNALVDTKTPGALGKRYKIYEDQSFKQLLEHLLARYPDDMLRVRYTRKSSLILPQGDRERIISTLAPDADFYIYGYAPLKFQHLPEPPAFHSIKAYGSVISHIIAPNSDAHRDYYRAAYNDAAANGTLLARADFDIYIHNGALHYLKENCETLPTGDGYGGFRVFLRVFPAAPADLPAARREFGFEDLTFRSVKHLGFFEGKCVILRELPDYPIARITTWQEVERETIWSADIDLTVHAAAQALHAGIAAGEYGQPVAQSNFDVYLRGGVLAYIKEPCAPGAAAARFFLHIFPDDPANLPADRREFGFENRDFRFADSGAYAGDKCMATRELPGYAIERIRTGQFVSGGGQLWSAEFTPPPRASR